MSGGIYVLSIHQSEYASYWNTIEPMTLVGHILTGAATGVLCKPKGISKKWEIVYYVVFMLLANIPDLRFKNWRHYRYEVSHSIFVNLLLVTMAVVLLSFLRGVRARIGGWKVIIGGVIAWLSHLLLDSFYNHGHGIAIFWPFSVSSFALPVPWFSVVPASSRFTSEGFRAYLIEFASYSPLLLLALGMKRSRAVQRLFSRFFFSRSEKGKADK